MESNNLSARRYDLDWLRVIVFGLLIFYHVGMFFVPWGWHVKNAEIYPWLKLPMSFLNQWRLPILFVISGMGTYFALGKRTGLAFAKERMIRLFLPLVFGIFFIVPPQVYFERLDKGQFAGNYFEYWPMHAFEGVYPVGNLSWHHLWFLPYLLVFSLILTPLFLYLRKNPENRLLRAINWLVASPVRVYALALPLYIWESLLEPFFPVTHALIGDWFYFTINLTFFLYGFLLLCAKDGFWKMAVANKQRFLVLGLLTFSAQAVIWLNLEDGVLVHFVEAALKVTNILSWIFAIFGYAAVYLNQDSKVLRYANEAVYPFYILHQTVTVGLGYYLKDADMGFLLKFSLMSLGTFLISWAIYEGFVRRWARPFFGLK